MSSFSLSIEMIPPLLLATVLVTGVLAVCFKLAYAGFKKYRQERHNAWLQTHEGKIATLQKQYAAEYKPYQTKQRVRKIIWAALGSVFVAFIIWWFLPEIVRSENIDSRIFMPVFAMLVSAPVFLAIWYFRDQNNLRELERQHQDVTLKEFQQLQAWATGNIENAYGKKGKLKEHAMTLQISALHSLRPYLRGEFGESFKRGAYEIFTSMLKIQHQKLLKILKNKELTCSTILNEIETQSLTKQINQIASEEWFNLLINHNFPTAGMSLVGVDLSGSDKYLRHRTEGTRLNLSDTLLQGANLMGAELQDADLMGAELQDANLIGAQLQGADLMGAQLQRADLRNAYLQGADLMFSELQGANLNEAHLQGANLRITNLQGADLSGAQFQGANLNTSKLQGACLIRAQLQGACLKDAQLQGADLKGAQLQGADLKGAQLQGAYLIDTQLQGVVINNLKRTALGLGDMFNARRVLKLAGVKSSLIEDDVEYQNQVMNESDLELLKTEFRKYQEEDIAANIIARIGKGTAFSAESGYCDFSQADEGAYTLEEAEKWIKEIEKYSTEQS